MPDVPIAAGAGLRITGTEPVNATSHALIAAAERAGRNGASGSLSPADVLAVAQAAVSFADAARTIRNLEDR